MQSNIATGWLREFAESANAYDHARHMGMISAKVQLFGVPGFDVIGFDDWSRQCEQEFSERAVREIRFEGLDVVAMTPLKIMFKTRESLSLADGSSIEHPVEMLIEKEADSKWRLTQERVLSEEEAAFDANRKVKS